MPAPPADASLHRHAPAAVHTCLRPHARPLSAPHQAGLQLAVNEEGRENELTGAVTAEPAILSFSNKAEPWRFEQGMPCWVCLGKAVILCGDCGGRGFGAGSLAYGGD